VFRRLTAVLVRDQADRVSASPEAEQSGQAKKASRHSCSHAAVSSRGDCCVTDLRTGTVGLVSRQLLGVGDHAPTTARQGLAVVVAVPGLVRFAVLLLANY
jgi:hypothetical protein